MTSDLAEVGGVTALHHFAGHHSLVSDALFRAVRLDLIICGSPVNRNSSTAVKGNLRSAVVGQAYDAPPSTVSSLSTDMREERQRVAVLLRKLDRC